MRKDLKTDLFGFAFGAFIGTLCALEIQSRPIGGEYLWILGTLMGGAIGWFFGEPGELKDAVLHAFHKIVYWKPYPLYWKTMVATCAGYLSIALSSGCVLFFLFPFAIMLEKSELDGIRGFFIAIPFVSALLATAVSLVFALVAPLSCLRKEEWELHRKNKKGLLLLKRGNPISILFRCATVIVSVVVFFFKNGPEILSAIKEGAVFFFVYAHSERRRIRFIGAFLGAVIGFFFGSAIVGAGAGVIVGVLSRELIAIRWLKVISAQVE